MFRQVIYVILALSISFISCGCGGGGGSNSGKTGTLILNITNASKASKLILPGEEMEPSTYVIIGDGPAGSTFTRTVTGEDTVEITGLVFGEWTISVEGLNLNNVSVGGGETTVTVHSGETTVCEITVSPFSGMGTLDLSINWEEELTNPYLEITMSRKGYDPFELTYELNDLLNSADVLADLDAGYYTFTVDLYDDTGGMEPHVGSAVEVVRIAQGLISSKTITITKQAEESGDGIGDIDNPAFPSPGAPVGSDAVSSSTNHSGRERETSPKLNALAGAAFVQAPQIGNYGSVSLSYAIDVSAGRAGMQPAVGLSYSSSGGDGLVGIGWNLGTGLGAITRTTRYGELYYDYRDVFTYNGKRLVKVSGPEESETGIYRLEIESGFSRFELTDAANGGIWRVYDKAGAVTVFGEDSTSRIVRPDNEKKTYIWNFSRSYDLNGNYMVAVYDTSEYTENRILYLKEIKYTGNYGRGTAARQYVRFNYKDRDDAYISKASGFIMKMNKLLDTVIVGWFDPRSSGFGGKDTELWRYTMVYEMSEDSGRPLLKTVNSSRQSTSPEFKYQAAEHSFAWKLVNNPDYDRYADPSKVKYFEGDFNGDGISDMVFFDPDTGLWKAAEGRRDGGYNFPTYGSRFRGYDSEEEIQFFKGNVTGDYNGDGRSDIAFYLPGTKAFWVAEHNGTNFAFKNYGRLAISGLDIMKCEWFTGDYDGNGLSDAVLFDETSGYWWLMANMGGEFEFIQFSKHFQNLFRDDYEPNSNMDSVYTSDASEYGNDRGSVYFFTGDFNGDGRTDISIYNSRDGKWWVAENYRDDSIGFRLNWKLYKIFTAPEQALFSNDRFTGDFNGDGFSDFLVCNKATGEWVLGETGDGTIDFKVISRAPQFRDITRWLQGDFNGDGRTDIGFYSKTDNNFWIGEATADGFRFRIYNNLAHGPDPDEVLETPLPKDEVKIETNTAVVSTETTTDILEYKYDGNYYQSKGEKVFTGSFTGTAGALFYRRNATGDLTKGWYHAEEGADSAAKISASAFTIDPENENISILNFGKPYRFSPGKDGILYFDRSAESFNLLNYGSAWQKTTLGTFSGFDIDNGLYMTGDFSEDGGGSSDSVLVLDAEGSGEPVFKLNSDSSLLNIKFEGSSFSFAPPSFTTIFTNYETAKSKIYIFTGNYSYNGELYHILMADTWTTPYTWFLGRVDESLNEVNFIPVDEPEANDFITEGYSEKYNSNGNDIVYSTLNNNRVRFHKITIETSDIKIVSYSSLASGITFDGDFDSSDNPVVKDGTEYKYFVAGAGTGSLVSMGDTTVKIEREDLLENYYPFQWIQGDYNGDGKTDIGIFHLGESKWYFANTTGTVPDLLSGVENGIGGAYKMSYINSSSLDNRGDDGLPHLSVNYKVCDRLTVEDGQGNSIVTKYDYKKGYAFSAFIDGFKETDYFGFGEFTVTDALGGRTISTYNSVPYDDFCKNRALAGAIKSSRFIGSDNTEYSRTEYDYKIHEIKTSGAPESPLNPPEGDLSVTSYLVEPVEVRTYKKDILTQTNKSNIVLAENEYEMISKTESTIDHYSDSAHIVVTVSAYSEYENLNDTNEMRLILRKNFAGSSNETTAEYEYDDKGNLESEILRYTGSGLASPANKHMVYEYDGFGNRIKETDMSGSPYRISEHSFEDAARLYQFVTEDRDWTGSIYLSTVYGYNYESAFGAVASKTDPNGNSTYFDFDDYGRIFRQRADTNYGDRRVLNEYYYTANLPDPHSAKVVQYTGTTDPVTEVRMYSDGMGRTIHTIGSAGPNTGNKKYAKSGLLEYDANGRLVRKSQAGWAADNEIEKFIPNTKEKYPTVFEFDASGRQKKVTQPAAFTGEKETFVKYTYNDPWETLTENSESRKKSTITNARGQVLYVHDSGTGDDGIEVNARMGFAYDATGNRIKKMDLPSPPAPLPGGEGSDFGMDLSIDEFLFSSGVKDSSGSNICQWKYDGFGRVIETSDPDMGYTEVEYNAFGDVIERTDGLNRTTGMSYDSLGRIIEKTLPGSEGSVTYGYDSISGSENTLGRMVEINDPAQRKIFSYDRMGRIDREIREIKTGGSGTTSGIYTTSFEYDLMNRKRSIVYPTDPHTGMTITARYKYSAMGVIGVDVLTGTGRKEIISGILYNEFGQMTEIDRGNGASTHYTYDIKGRLSRLLTNTETNDQTRKLQDVTYMFKTDGSIASVVNTPDIDTNGGYLSTISYSYEYDGLNRLVRANGQYAKSSVPNGTTQDVLKSFEHGFEYAANGNMLAKSITDPDTGLTDRREYTYGEYNHAVMSISSSLLAGEKYSMQYDAVGNMISETSPQGTPPNPPLAGGATIASKTMEYDSYNRITAVTDADTSEDVGQYWYDDGGFRVRKLAKRHVSGEDRQVEVLYPSMYFGLEKQKDSDGNDIANANYAVNNVYLEGVRVAAVIPSGAAQYYLTDQVDSVKVVVNDDGQAVTRMEYLPFGETWFQEGSENNAPKYNSQELDPESGFYYYNARHYDADVSRFVTPDSVIDGEYDTQGWNRYSYCHNNPLKYKDPTGHQAGHSKDKLSTNTYPWTWGNANPLVTTPGIQGNTGVAAGRSVTLINDALTIVNNFKYSDPSANESQAMTNVIIAVLQNTLIFSKDMSQVDTQTIMIDVYNFVVPGPSPCEPAIRLPDDNNYYGFYFNTTNSNNSQKSISTGDGEKAYYDMLNNNPCVKVDVKSGTNLKYSQNLLDAFLSGNITDFINDYSNNENRNIRDAQADYLSQLSDFYNWRLSNEYGDDYFYQSNCDPDNNNSYSIDGYTGNYSEGNYSYSESSGEE